MTLVTVPRGPRAVGLDICYACASVWFDVKEGEVLQSLYGMDEPPTRMLDHKWKYGLQFPRVRLLILVRWLFFFPVRLRAGFAILLWFLLQGLGAWLQIHGSS